MTEFDSSMSFTQEEIATVGAKFEQWVGGLTERERACLASLAVASAENQVEGFNMAPGLKPVASQSMFGSVFNDVVKSLGQGLGGAVRK